MSLRQRFVALEFGTRGQTGRRIEGLRVSFDVQLSTSSTANTAKIVVYNLAPSSVSLLQQPGSVVRLLAGYSGGAGQGVPRLLIEAELVPGSVRSEKRGPDRITTIEVSDGGPQIGSAFVSQEFGGVPTAQDLLDSVTGALGFGEGAVTLPDLQLTKGLSLFGPASDVLDRLAEGVGGQWWVDSGQVYIAPSGAPVTDSAVLFSVSNKNLIGSPTPTDKGLQVTGLLDSSVRPGSRYRVQSEGIPGTDYVANAVRYQGDTHGQPWYVIATGRPL